MRSSPRGGRPTPTGRPPMVVPRLTADTEASETNDRSEELFVRSIVAVELVPLDDVMESPEEWAFPTRMKR
jgi:hypothetical protein